MSNPQLELVNETDASAEHGTRENAGIMESLVKVWMVRRIGHGDTETEIIAALETCELAQIEKIVQKPVDERRDAYREQFLRNMAFVALTSRLATALRNMVWSAESFSKRKRYGRRARHEFDFLWREYEDRFGIDFQANADRIAFAETMRNVRNRIVHEGGEDTSFSKKYPEYVSGSGIGAQVTVSEEQLAQAVKNSIDLVSWLAGQLRKKELAAIKAKSSQ